MARLLAIVLAVLFAVPVTRAEARQGSIEEGQRLLSVIADKGNFRLIEVSRDGYTLGLVDDSGHTLGALYLNLTEHDPLPRVHSRSFTMSIGNFAPDPTIIDRLVHAAGTIAEWDGGRLPDQQPRTGTGPLDLQIKVTIFVVIMALLLGIWRRGRVIVDLRLPHILQVTAHTSIFLYWSIYFMGVRYHLPSIAVQIVLAYAADAAFCFLRFGSWRVGLSPLPVVFSTNLFEWFDSNGVVITLLVAFGTKAFIHRGGRHIFNPSVAGLTTAGIISILFPDFVHFGSAFHTLNIPPNMAEWVILAALLPQTRFRILPVSIGAMLALWYTGNPACMRPAIILAFTLLASDPATTPRTDIGKLLFGAVVGFALPVFSIFMRSIGQPDDFAKVWPVAVANVLVPQLDVLGGRIAVLAVHLSGRAAKVIRRHWVALGQQVDRLGTLMRRPLPNYVFVGCWLVICLVLLREEKPRDFEPALHWNWGTPLVVRDADDVPRCTSNPVFCKTFTFAQEVALWLDHDRTPTASK